MLTCPAPKLYHSMLGNQMSLKSFYQNMIEIKFGHHFEYKRTLLLQAKSYSSVPKQCYDYFVIFKPLQEIEKIILKRRSLQKKKILTLLWCIGEKFGLQK